MKKAVALIGAGIALGGYLPYDVNDVVVVDREDSPPPVPRKSLSDYHTPPRPMTQQEKQFYKVYKHLNIKNR